MESVESHALDAPLLQPVDPGEIAFAMALFVAAARGQVHGPQIGVSGFPLSETRVELDEIHGYAGDEASPDSLPLSRAVSVLWHHYQGDARQRTIWCRVVAFHVMMVRCEGLLVKPWTTICAKDEDSAFLEPAVVHAVATASLREFEQFADAPFLEAVSQFDTRPPIATAATASAPLETPQFRLFESLRSAVADMGGKRSFDALLSRALIGPNSRFPWLRSMPQLTPGELFERIDHQLDPDGPNPSATEVAEAEAAVIASVVELLQLLLGEAVTLRLLQSARTAEALAATRRGSP